MRSGLRQCDTVLTLIFAATIAVRRLANLVALEEQHLRAAFARVDLGGQRRGIREFKRHIAFPLGLERRHVDDDAATRVGALSQSDGHDVSGNAKVLDGAGKRKTVWRNDDVVAFDVDKTLVVEFFWVDNRAVHVGK